MKGLKALIGLIVLLALASGCVEMTGDSTSSPSLEVVDLSEQEIENVTGAEYLVLNSSGSSDFNVSSAVEEAKSVFQREDNLSEAPETVKSMVVALNGSEGIEKGKASELSVKGFEARRKDSDNSTTIYGSQGNVSLFVKTEGSDGLFSSARDLYLVMARELDEFRG